ncbi:chaperonin 10-like protein [Rhizoctonia solani]|nr:chaperonin 10-like protein [Rhizoctonia solani]
MTVQNKTMPALKLYPDPLELRFEIEPNQSTITRTRGLCGSDLHAYRGLESFDTPYITGHELVGIVVSLGESFRNAAAGRPELYSTLKVGDKVVSPFTSSCGECRPCRIGFTARCEHSLLFGSPNLPGAQAQYIRVPHAGGTLFRIPQDESILGNEPVARIGTSDDSLILLADILPTGYFAALQAIQHPNLAYAFARKSFPVIPNFVNAFVTGGESIKVQESDAKLVFAVVGLGPVGLCALVSLVELLGLSGTSNFAIVAVDPNEARRAKAESILGALGVVSLEDASGVSKELSGGLGCDAVLEPARDDIGMIGVHTHPQFPLNGDALYSKNVSLAFGRCPVRSIFPYCIELLMSRQDIFSVGGVAGLIERIIPFDESSVKEAYRMFNEGKCGKVLFRMPSD